MKIEALGIEWGAAYEEAQPKRISHFGREVEVFVDENHNLVVVLPPGTHVTLGSRNGGPAMYATVTA